MQLQVGLKAFIKNKDGKYLFLKRTSKMPGESEKSYTIPGGRIDPTESIEVGLAREIKEETGLELKEILKVVTAQDIFRHDKGFHIVRITFEVTAEGTVEIGNDVEDDHGEYIWASLEETQKLPIELQLQPVLRMLDDK